MQNDNVKFKMKGIATFEILIAMALLVIFITMTLPLLAGSQSTSIGSQTNQEALYKAQKLLEDERSNAKLDFNLVNPISSTSDGIYNKSVSVSFYPTPTDYFAKKVTSTVTWQGPNAQNLSVNLSTLITNPDAVNGGDTCGSVLEGNWSNPQISAPIDVGTTPSGNPVQGINVFEGKIYITTDNSHGQNNDFYIYDISLNPQNPTIVGAPNGIDANGVKSGLNDVAISKNGSNKYAYVANAYDANFSTCVQGPSCSQMRIIDVTDPTSPILGQSYKLPGVSGNVGAHNNQAVGKSIFYKDGYVYLGLTKTLSGPEFNVIDVHNPSVPFFVGSYPVGRSINAIRVKNNYAYLTTDDNNKELIVLDVSVKSSPTLVGTYNAMPDSTNFGYGKGLNLVGNKVYLSRTYISNAPEFLVLDNSNPGVIPQTPLGFNDVGISSDPQSVNGIIIRDYLGFLITTDYIQVWNIANLSSMNLIRSFNLSDIVHSGSVGSGSDCEGNYIYIGSYRTSNDKGVILVLYPGP